jgi:hypothetical protein
VISLPLISNNNNNIQQQNFYQLFQKEEGGKNDKYPKNIAYRNALKASRTQENNNKSLK